MSKTERYEERHRKAIATRITPKGRRLAAQKAWDKHREDRPVSLKPAPWENDKKKPV